MLGDDGDLQAMLIQSVKKGNITMKGSAEEWIAKSSDRARELLANIGKTKPIDNKTLDSDDKQSVITISKEVSDLFAM